MASQPKKPDPRTTTLRSPGEFEDLNEGTLSHRSPPTDKTSGIQVKGTSLKSWASSWNQFQDAASTLLANGPSVLPKRKPLKRQGSDSKIRQTTSNYIKDTRYRTKPAAKEWGALAHPVQGLRAELNSTPTFASLLQPTREDLLQARRREELLSGRTEYGFKRRNSDEAIRGGRRDSSEPGSHAEETLVYLHHVRPSDTFAGILITYNCSAPAFRRANRLGANDNVQCLRTVVLPVNACRIRSKPITEDLLTDLNASSSSERPTSSLANGLLLAPQSNSELEAPQISPSVSTTSTTHSSVSLNPAPWTHEKYVLLPSLPHRVEIARLPSSQISYFPPPRRKTGEGARSGLNSPATSFDLPRRSTEPESPPFETRTRPGPNSRHSRRKSAFLPTGPGGVGTLDTKTPGPGQDGLNKHLVPRLPKIMQPPSSHSEQYHSSTTLFSTDHLATQGSRPRSSHTRAKSAALGAGQPSIPLEESPFNSSKGSFDEADRTFSAHPPARSRTLPQGQMTAAKAAQNAKVIGDKALVGLESFGALVGKGLEGVIKKATDALEIGINPNLPGTAAGSEAVSRVGTSKRSGGSARGAGPSAKGASSTSLGALPGADRAKRISRMEDEGLNLIELDDALDGELERADSARTIRARAAGDKGWSSSRGTSGGRSRADSTEDKSGAVVRVRGRRVMGGDGDD